MQTWIVTGGAGFIGSNFVRLALRARDVRVIVLDKLTYAGNLASLEDVIEHPRLTFVEGDIADRATVQQVFAAHRPSAVLNFAAESHVDRSIDGPGAFVQTNIVGTFELLDAARVHWAGLGAEDKASFRFLHVSTDEVYGTLGDAGLFSEDTPYAPNSPYAASKAAADHLVRAWYHTYGLPVVITNCSNNYGPYQFPEKLIPLMLLNGLEGKTPAHLRGRRQRPRLALRRGPLHRHPACARARTPRREVQHRRRERADEPRDRRPALRSPRGSRPRGVQCRPPGQGPQFLHATQDVRPRPPRARPAIRDRCIERSAGSWAGRPTTISAAASIAPSSGTSPIGSGAARCLPGHTGGNGWG